MLPTRSWSNSLDAAAVAELPPVIGVLVAYLELDGWQRSDVREAIGAQWRDFVDKHLGRQLTEPKPEPRDRQRHSTFAPILEKWKADNAEYLAGEAKLVAALRERIKFPEPEYDDDE